MDIRPEVMERCGRALFVEKMATMLIDVGSVLPGTDRKLLCVRVAQALDEAEQSGIRTERLAGMYVILKISDKVSPYAVPAYARILQDPTLAEADKAHLIQMIRIGEL